MNTQTLAARMRLITITKSRAGHYWLTVRDSAGRILLRDMFDNLDAARRAACPEGNPLNKGLYQ
jgi:hypothetical protein